MQSIEQIYIDRRLTDLEYKLDSILNALKVREASDWVDRKTICQIMGCSERHLFELIAKGCIYGDAIKNIGTAKRARYLFHRKLAFDQYLNRLL